MTPNQVSRLDPLISLFIHMQDDVVIVAHYRIGTDVQGKVFRQGQHALFYPASPVVIDKDVMYACFAGAKTGQSIHLRRDHHHTERHVLHNGKHSDSREWH